jgi:hypothetical protein
MRRLPLLACLLLLAQTSAYTIRVSGTPDAGQKMKVSSESRSKQLLTMRDRAGNVMHTSTVEQATREAWTDTMLRRAGANQTFRRTYEVAEIEQGGRKLVLPLQSQTITFTVRGENVGIMAANGVPLPEDVRQRVVELVRRELRSDANNNCAPKTPLAIGGTWTLTAAQTNDCFNGLGSIDGGATGSGTLTAVDRGYATIDFRYNFRLDALGPLVFDAPAPLDGTMRVRVSLTDPLDWTETESVHLVGTAHPRGPSMPSVTTDLRATSTLHAGR